MVMVAELDPLVQHLTQRFQRRAAVNANHREIDGRRGFQRGVRQQRSNQLLLLNFAGFRLEHEAHRRVFVGLITYHVQHRQHAGFEVGLVQTQRFFASFDLGIGDFFNLFQHFLGAHANRQLGDDQLPLATRQLFNLPAGTHFERATACAVSVRNVRRAADDLTATRIIGTRHDGEQLVVAQLRRFDQGDASIGDFAQVVAGDFCRQTDRDAARAIQQREWQTGGQLAGLGFSCRRSWG